jgi:hypothetical protein
MVDEKALLLLQAHEAKRRLIIADNAYRNLVTNLEALVHGLKDHRRDLIVEYYESLFLDGRFRQVWEKRFNAEDDNTRLQDAVNHL